MNYTIVTCLYDLKKRDNTEKRRDIKFYLDLTQDFECNIVIYTEPGLKDEILKRKTKGNIKIIERDFEQLEYYKKYNQSFKDELKYSIKDDKNTNNYFILTWNKFMFMKECIENNYFNTDYFYWLDYGLQHVFNEKGNNPKINTLLENFEKIEKKGIEKIIFMILNDLNPNIINNENFYNRLYQYCAGGIFGGKKDNFIKVIELFDNKVKELIDKKIVSTEEHIMADVIYNNKDLFELSYGDYYELIDNFYPYEIKENKDYVNRILNLNLSNNEDKYIAMDIIKKMYNNFSEIKSNHHYIYNNIFKKFYDRIYRKECYDCGIKLIESIEKGYVNFSNDIYFDIIFKMYIVSYYVKEKEETKKYVDYIFNNKDLYNKYLTNKDFYDKQFSYCK